MIIIKIDTSDASESEKKFYRDIELRISHGFEDDITEMLEHFKRFLGCLGYNMETIERISLRDCDEVNDKE